MSENTEIQNVEATDNTNTTAENTQSTVSTGNRKTVYVMFNDKDQSLYNKTLGTWNDGMGTRDGSSVWTFSARKPAEESNTIVKALAWLENLGFKNIRVELVEVEIDEKGKASIVEDDEVFIDPAEVEEENKEETVSEELSEEGISEEEMAAEEIDVEASIEAALLAEAENTLKNVA